MPIPYKKLKNLAEVQKLQDSDITVIEDQDTTRKGTLHLSRLGQKKFYFFLYIFYQILTDF